MRALSASDVLAVWERGLDAGPNERALDLLSMACPESDADALATLSIGERDARLIRLRQWTFGRTLTGIVDCGQCATQLELTFDPEQLLAIEVTAQITLTVDGYDVTLRPPNSRDLAAASEDHLDRARRQLFESCVMAAQFRGSPVPASQLPDAVVDEAERCLADADPRSDITLAATCPDCGARRDITLDIVLFFWREIDAWAPRLLREVHTLAAAYGWSERDILALTPLRRRCYLDLVGG